MRFVFTSQPDVRQLTRSQTGSLSIIHILYINIIINTCKHYAFYPANRSTQTEAVVINERVCVRTHTHTGVVYGDPKHTLAHVCNLMTSSHTHVDSSFTTAAH